MISIVGLNRMTLLLALCDTGLHSMIENDVIKYAIDMHPLDNDVKSVIEMILNADELDQHRYDAIAGQSGIAAILIGKMRSDNARDLDRRYLEALRNFDDARNAMISLNMDAISDPTKSSLAYRFVIRTRDMWRGVRELRSHTLYAEAEMYDTHTNPELAEMFYAIKSEAELENPAPVIVSVLNDAADGVLRD